MSRRHGRRQGRNDELLQGLLLVDKPVDLTSHDVCQRVRSRLRLGKVGHGGTLDPFATGLLPLLLNGATRLMPELQAEDKVYEATIRLGVRTDTMDPTGEVTAEADASGVDDAAIQAALAGFLGTQQQVIPRFSAARVDGKRLYEYAREGEDVELPSKEITILALDLLAVRRDGERVDVDVRVHCTSGTYVRALADDLGQALGVGALLLTLRRTRIGKLDIARAISLDAIDEQATVWRDERDARKEAGEEVRFEPSENTAAWKAVLGDALMPVAELLGGVPVLRLPAALAERVRGGNPLRKGEIEALEGELPRFLPGDRLAVEDAGGVRTLAVVRAACARDALPRRPDSAVVLEIERVLR
jgi:tRNA pseudouridine55 synthase